MIDSLFSTLAPHLCCGCGKIGTILCDNCKYDNSDVPFVGCVLCSTNNNRHGICLSCQRFALRGWCVGQRSGTLRKLIDDYKFERVQAARHVLADLLNDRVDHLPPETIIVPIPTIPSHVRQRGYDHAMLLARAFARRRHLVCRPLLYRATITSQRDASRSQRLTQAKTAFTVRRSLSPNVPYLIVDDIVTTGATLKYAALALRKAGAREVWVAAVARQSLD